ncbi:EAL domain-containing protein [Clostridium uliginosum]|uniref:Diguanylate cyclase (GGDEF) domain-containing protein n=1 Tax=Clostridium uliginosum TaxID=119641 RepID=A0A1I1PR33_9CLOT|nr:diguanylate cyclase (GGDEF) domain-containing protein [Clostridium uliginosum]
MNQKNNSIIRKLTIPMIIALLTQSIFYVIIILCSGTLQSLKNNEFETFNETVTSRNNYLNNEMLNHWSNIDESEKNINGIILKTLEVNNLKVKDLDSDSEIKSEILSNVSKPLMHMIGENHVNGAFVILDDKTTNTYNNTVEKSGIYIKDSDPIKNSLDNSDLRVKVGPNEVSKKMKISLDSSWTNNFHLNKDMDFFYKPINAAKQYKDLPYNDLGYWSNIAGLSDALQPSITYTVPLLDNEGNPYGVLGVEIELEYMKTLLPYNEMDSNKNGSYIICVDTNNDMKFKNVVSNGTIKLKGIEGLENITFEDKEVYKDIYELQDDEYIKNTTYSNIKYFNLYNYNTPFKNEKWALVGIIEKDSILYYINRFKYFLVLDLIISTLIGILIVYIAANRVTIPIRNLAKKVREDDPLNPLVLEKINISEIDDLSLAIANLRIKATDSASKLSQIIGLLNMPIGAFEHKKDEDMVFCTEAFFSVIGIDDINRHEAYTHRVFFKEILKIITTNPEPDLDNVYKIEKENKQDMWIKLTIFEDESKMLGVVIDVTQEVLEKCKIEYERDYDILTNLLNRRAFYNRVNKKLQEDIEIAAFVMLDLDNLKYVNDTYGHDYGDKYIKKAAIVLEEFTEHNGIVSRISGDEFYVFIHGYDDKDKIRQIIKRIHKNMKQSSIILPDNNELKIRASAGVAWYPDDSTKYEELTKYCDFAMYKIKNTAKGNLNEFNRDDYNKDSFLLSSKEELNKLIDEELVKYAFQPIVNANTGEIYGYEALMRSQLDTLKNPLDIIRLATSQFRLYQIERLTWFKALESFVEYKEEFGEAKIFLNSIPNYVLSDEDLDEFKQLYSPYCSKIVLELLENERSNGEHTAKKRKLIEEWGAKIALDDFGSGYNNEALLLEITPDIVKIDISIIIGIDKDLNRQQILQNIISYSKQRGIKILAEGIETKGELEKVIEFGVDYIQGYYLSKPEFIPPKISEKLVKEILDINTKLC